MSVTNMVAELLVAFGTESLKQRYVPKLLSGEYIAGSFGLTESYAGSDPASIRTTAVENDNGYLFKPGDAEDLAQKIAYVWNLSKEKKEQIKNIAYQTVKNRFLANNYIEVITKIYEQFGHSLVVF